MDRVEALQKALDIYRMEERTHGPEYATMLGETKLFTHMEIASICEISPYMSRMATNGIPLPKYRFGEKFDPKTLDMLVTITVHYRNTGQVPKGLLDMTRVTTSISVISRLTGIGVSELAEATDL